MEFLSGKISKICKMSVLRSLLKTENISVLKHWNSIMKFNQAAEFGAVPKKLQVPAPPKRPLSAYMIFCKDNRQNLLKDIPDLTSTEVIKHLAARWSQLSIENKKPYEDMARKNTVLYGEAHKKFYESLTEEQKEEIVKNQALKQESKRLLKLKKDLKESGLPRPAMPAYAFFVQSHAKDDIKNASDFLKEVAEKWKVSSESIKKSFKKQAEVDRERYVTELLQWRLRMAKEGRQDLLERYDHMRRRADTGPIPAKDTAPKTRSQKSG